MSTHKKIDRICVIAIVLALLLTILCMNGEALGIQASDRAMGYETRLFDTSKVHTIDIIMDDWDSFIASAQSEEYSVCAVVIDGEVYSNVGIRGKGNTSLSTVASMNSDRYSFKIEFDQYDSTKSYYGLDKLSLNNIIQDTTYMKDYLTYRLMGQFGVAAPLCSYVYITVNGEDWGLYLAVEAVEDAFLQRNYGTDYGELYKPDSLSFGGGRGNGMNFDMDDFMNSFEGNETDSVSSFDPGDSADNQEGQRQAGQTRDNGASPSMPSGDELQGMPGMDRNQSSDPAAESSGGRAQSEQRGMGGDMSMGSSDVMLQYIDDDPDSYSNIFDSAKTDITTADQARLIASLQALSNGTDIGSVVDVEQVIRYFVVHNFVVNADSYTGSMIHNYYLYEEDGQLSMIPWDYNLAFGTFQGNDAASAVNDPIDSPLSVTGDGSRPIIDWIFSDEEYTALYHQYFAEFLETADFAALIDEAEALIAPYVAQDPTAFYSYEEFEAGAAALREFCLLREESVLGQLDGTIPSTAEGQSADRSTLVDASQLNLSAMGSMGDTTGGAGSKDHMSSMGSMGDMGNMGDMGGERFQNPQDTQSGSTAPSDTMTPPDASPSGGTPTAPARDAQFPSADSTQQFPGGQQIPGDLSDRTDGSFPDNLPGSTSGNAAITQNGNSLISLLVSGIVLLLGLLVAFLFKR